MGTSASSGKAETCPFCANRLPAEAGPILECPRCNGKWSPAAEKRSTEARARRPVGTGVVSAVSSESEEITAPLVSRFDKSSDKSEAVTTPPLDYLWVGLFAHSLKDTEEKHELDEDLFVDNYLRPYFDKHFDTQLEKGFHIMTRGAHFKVRGCFPPRGKVTSETRIWLNDGRKAIFERQVFLLHRRAIVKMHVLPSLESFKTSEIFRNALTSMARTRPTPPMPTYDMDATFNSHIKPYLMESDPVLLDDFHSSRVSEKRHFICGDTFVKNGIEFKIMACDPMDGNVNRETQVFLAGKPIADLKSLKMRPVLETIPEEWRSYTPQRLYDVCLKPYLFGLNNGRHYFNSGIRELSVSGVVFRFTEKPEFHLSAEEKSKSVAMTEGGLFSQLTAVTPWTKAIGEHEMETLRIDDDLALARRLQEEENRREIEERARRSAAATGTRPRYVVQFGTQRMEIPPDSDAARILEQLHIQRQERLSMEPQMQERWANLDAFIERTAVLVYLQELQQQRELERDRRRALPTEMLTALPTWQFKAKVPSGSSPMDEDLDKVVVDADPDDDKISCRICLEEFEDGIRIKALPCMHQFHTECIDHWLKVNRTCPICKNDIAASLGRAVRG